MTKYAVQVTVTMFVEAEHEDEGAEEKQVRAVNALASALAASQTLKGFEPAVEFTDWANAAEQTDEEAWNPETP